jgi:hypothetical protein
MPTPRSLNRKTNRSLRPGNSLRPAIVTALLFFCACTEPDAPLTCQWFHDDNCWKTAVEEMTACVPGASAWGLLSEDRTSCAYPDGTVVDMDLPSDGNGGTLIFQVAAGGDVCLAGQWTLEAPRSEITLTTASGTFAYREDDAAAALTCHDGKTYRTDDRESLAACLESPGIIDPYGVYGASVTVAVRGPAGAEVVLINCR